MCEYVGCVSQHTLHILHYKKHYFKHTCSKNTINRINFHQDLWMLYDVSALVNKKSEKMEKKRRIEKIDSSNPVTALTNIQSSIGKWFFFRKMYALVDLDTRINVLLHIMLLECTMYSITFSSYVCLSFSLKTVRSSNIMNRCNIENTMDTYDESTQRKKCGRTTDVSNRITHLKIHFPVPIH